MFWQTDLAKTSSHLDELLDNGSATLDDVLADEFTIQEGRNGNDKLIQFLTNPQIIMTLLTGALEPDIDTSLPFKDQYKRAHQCSEILSLNNVEITSAIVNNETACEMLLNYLNGRQINYVLAGFYMKILTQLVSRQLDEMLSRMKDSEFLNYCLQNMQFSAVMELLFRLVSGPSDTDQQDFVKQWLVEGHLVETLCDLLVPSQPPVVHENVGNLWSELVRILRDAQYSSENKRHDSLLESLQSERNVRNLVNRMLVENVDKQRCESLICSAAGILTTLLETNFIPNCPSHQLGNEELNNISHRISDSSSAENELNGATVWQPDAGHVVETVVAASTDRIVSAIIASFKAGDDKLTSTDVWCPLMRLLVGVLDTNHLATQQAVLSAFSSLKFDPIKVFLTIASTRPKMNVFHHLISRAISYILYTLSPTPSPLITYLFKGFSLKRHHQLYTRMNRIFVYLQMMMLSTQNRRVTEVGLLEQILTGVDSSQTELLSSCARRSIRGFYMNLALIVHCACDSSPNADYIQALIRESDQATRWQAFIKEIDAYAEINRCDDTGITPPPASNVVDTAKIDACDVPEPMVNNTVQMPPLQLLSEYEQFFVPKPMPEDIEISYPCSSHDTDYDIPDVTPDCDMSKDYANIGSEEMFEAMCTLRINTSITDKKTVDELSDAWPGMSQSKELEERTTDVNDDAHNETFPTSWDDLASFEATAAHARENVDRKSPTSDIKIRKCVIEDWPESAKESNSADSWADFTSMKADDWPPLDARPNDGWNDEAVWREQIPEADTVLSPTTTAIVGGIATALIAGTSASDSETKSTEC